MTRSLPSRTRVVPKQWRRTWGEKSSGMPASPAIAARMSVAPLLVRRPPRRLSRSAVLVVAPGQPGRSSLIHRASCSRSTACRGTSAVASALAGPDDDLALAGPELDVGGVQGDGLADAQAGVERDQGDDAVAGVEPAFDGAQPPGGVLGG